VSLQNVLNLAPRWQGHLNVQGSADIGENNSILDNLYNARFSIGRGVVNESGDVEYLTNRLTGMVALGINKTAGFDVQLAPRLGAAVTVAKNTIVKASWGQAYRVPDLFALKNPSVGNPNLVPEKVNGMDAGVQHRFGNVTLSETYFYNLFSNLIDFSSTEFRLVNRTRVRTQGVESEASVALARGVQVKAWGSYLNWKIESSAEPLRDEPHGQAGVSVEAALPKHLRASSTTLWVGRRYDFQLPAPAVSTVGGYSTSNLIVGYDGLRRVGVFARVDNIFDRRFHEYLGFPNPGISCRLGVTYRVF
jgi:vitamin B12 transporter